MLRAFDHDILSPVTAELFVKPDTGGGNDTPRDDVAMYHQRGGREFFGLSESDVRALAKMSCEGTFLADGCHCKFD